MLYSSARNTTTPDPACAADAPRAATRLIRWSVREGSIAPAIFRLRGKAARREKLKVSEMIF